MIYFDNNATTIIPSHIQKDMLEYINCGNPSQDNKLSIKLNELFEQTKTNIYNFLKIDKSIYDIIFTSGASESNSFIIRSIVDSYIKHKKDKPHIITSNAEHKSILLCLEHLLNLKIIEVTYVPILKSGIIDQEIYMKSFRPNTTLVCLIHANNEIGSINPINKLAEIAHNHNAVFYSDTTQSIAKIVPEVEQIGKHIDAFCISAHKFNGPSGIGAVIIKKKLLSGYRLCPIIYGTQNNGYRGGTENVIGITGMNLAIIEHTKTHTINVDKTLRLKSHLLNLLYESFKVYIYSNFEGTDEDFYVLLFSLCDKNPNLYLPNTVYLSFVKVKEPYLCNSKIKKRLEDHDIIVGIGSACNTTSMKASHIADALKLDKVIRRGMLRISFDTHNTIDDVNKFVKTMKEILNEFN